MDTVTVAKVAVKAATYAIDKPYDYDIPQTLLPRLKPGMRVILPFGPGSRRTEGIVLALEQGDRKSTRLNSSHRG